MPMPRKPGCGSRFESRPPAECNWTNWELHLWCWTATSRIMSVRTVPDGDAASGNARLLTSREGDPDEAES